MARKLPLFVDAEQLHDVLGLPHVQIVAVDPAGDYARAHIPGALQIDMPDFTTSAPPVAGLLPDEAALAEALSDAGLRNDAHIVAYDRVGDGHSDHRADRAVARRRGERGRDERELLGLVELAQRARLLERRARGAAAAAVGRRGGAHGRRHLDSIPEGDTDSGRQGVGRRDHACAAAEPGEDEQDPDTEQDEDGGESAETSTALCGRR